MKKFIQENPTLAFGLLFPLFMAVVFAAASGLPALYATPPAYDALFMANNMRSGRGLQIEVQGGKVQASYISPCNGCGSPVLLRYRSAEGRLERLNLPDFPQQAHTPPPVNTPNATEIMVTTPVILPALDGLRITPGFRAPDGYEFIESPVRRRSGGLLTELFFSRPYSEYAPILKNGSYEIRLPEQPDGGYYYSSHVRFIGWVER